MKKTPESKASYMFEPRKLALMKTTTDPTHMITKTLVITVVESEAVRNASVAERSKHSTRGPQRSPLSDIEYNFAVISCLSPLAREAWRSAA